MRHRDLGYALISLRICSNYLSPFVVRDSAVSIWASSLQTYSSGSIHDSQYTNHDSVILTQNKSSNQEFFDFHLNLKEAWRKLESRSLLSHRDQKPYIHQAESILT